MVLFGLMDVYKAATTDESHGLGFRALYKFRVMCRWCSNALHLVANRIKRLFGSKVERFEMPPYPYIREDQKRSFFGQAAATAEYLKNRPWEEASNEVHNAFTNEMARQFPAVAIDNTKKEEVASMLDRINGETAQQKNPVESLIQNVGDKFAPAIRKGLAQSETISQVVDKAITSIAPPVQQFVDQGSEVLQQYLDGNRAPTTNASENTQTNVVANNDTTVATTNADTNSLLSANTSNQPDYTSHSQTPEEKPAPTRKERRQAAESAEQATKAQTTNTLVNTAINAAASLHPTLGLMQPVISAVSSSLQGDSTNSENHAPNTTSTNTQQSTAGAVQKPATTTSKTLVPPSDLINKELNWMGYRFPFTKNMQQDIRTLAEQAEQAEDQAIEAMSKVLLDNPLLPHERENIIKSDGWTKMEVISMVLINTFADEKTTQDTKQRIIHAVSLMSKSRELLCQFVNIQHAKNLSMCTQHIQKCLEQREKGLLDVPQLTSDAANDIPTNKILSAIPYTYITSLKFFDIQQNIFKETIDIYDSEYEWFSTVEEFLTCLNSPSDDREEANDIWKQLSNIRAKANTLNVNLSKNLLQFYLLKHIEIPAAGTIISVLYSNDTATIANLQARVYPHKLAIQQRFLNLKYAEQQAKTQGSLGNSKLYKKSLPASLSYADEQLAILRSEIINGCLRRTLETFSHSLEANVYEKIQRACHQTSSVLEHNNNYKLPIFAINTDTTK